MKHKTDGADPDGIVGKKSRVVSILLLCAVGGLGILTIFTHGADGSGAMPGDAATPGKASLQSIAPEQRYPTKVPWSTPATIEPSNRAGQSDTIVLGPGSTPIATAKLEEAVRAYRAGQNNAFFDQKAFLRSFAPVASTGVESLLNELRSAASLMALPGNVSFIQDMPEPVLDRMAMIDMLSDLADDEPSALEALVEIATTPIDSTLPPQVIKAMVGEKYDAFVEIAQRDWPRASTAFAQMKNAALKEALRPALLSGLLDSGVTREEAIRMVEQI